MPKRFAAFIMTYERVSVLENTIHEIIQQTKPPEKVLIVDNSESYETEQLIKKLANPGIEYFRVGHNDGPAGAAKIGLQRLLEEGYQWIYWGDDDDPPMFSDAFEKLFQLISQTQNDRKVGLVGAVGQYFNSSTGEIERVQDSFLNQVGYITVDSIAGNQCMIVNADVVRAGVMPSENMNN